MINSNKCMSSRWNSNYHPYVKNSIFVIYLNPSPAPENYYNLSLIFEKIGFPFSSDQNIKFVADYKLREAIKILHRDHRDHRGELINWVLQKLRTLIG